MEKKDKMTVGGFVEKDLSTAQQRRLEYAEKLSYVNGQMDAFNIVQFGFLSVKMENEYNYLNGFSSRLDDIIEQHNISDRELGLVSMVDGNSKRILVAARADLSEYDMYSFLGLMESGEDLCAEKMLDISEKMTILGFHIRPIIKSNLYGCSECRLEFVKIIMPAILPNEDTQSPFE